ncbi:MAG: bifunctional isocitrate dehydrogenase kinase/phosphatase [Desulfobacterales bacterium]
MPPDARFYAQHLLKAFDAYHETFKAITRRAGDRFRSADWQGIRTDAVERLEIYSRTVDRTVSEIKEMIGERGPDEAAWRAVKTEFSEIIRDRYEYQLAETFYNSVIRRVFAVAGVNPAIEFTISDFKIPVVEEKPCPICSAYINTSSGRDLDTIISKILSDFSTQLPFMDREGESLRIARAIGDDLSRQGIPVGNISIEMADPVFYRNKGAYLIGRMQAGERIMPLVFCILHINERIFVDAVLMEPAELSILFSFANAYFHVDIPSPEEMINFLKSMMPEKRVSEIYTSLGYHKHGKAELYRELVRSPGQTDERFEIPPGEEGMVMLVFTIPSLNVVFKMIRDQFDYPKKTTPDYIKNRYRLVFRHDRAGRLVDAQEFDHLKFEASRFSETLIKALKEKAAKNLVFQNGQVIIRHLYTERRLTPLDVYIRENPPEAVKDVLLDYGWAVKELAASNIFPGDLFFKNFGVTRWGRVVFYDYDELSLLTDCSFKKIPEPESYEEIMSDEPWFSVSENDVFPEEFRKFLHFPDHVRPIFEELHGDLFDVYFWQDMQEKINSGILIHILPYKNHRRFDHQILEASGIYYTRQ